MKVKDRFCRPMDTLRVSVTDRCNFRCGYCMPSDVFGTGYAFSPQDTLLDFEEITRLAALFTRLGVRKFRLTGGEPLLRRGLPSLVAGLRGLTGVEEVALTTNGWLLADQAQALKQAGLGRVTISLDSLDPRVFARMNGVGLGPERVVAAIRAAMEAGLNPVKVNTVVQRGVNDHTLVALARMFKEMGVMVRFIEYMDVGGAVGWHPNQVVSEAEIWSLLDRHLGLEHPGEDTAPLSFPRSSGADGPMGEVATVYRYRDGSAAVGVIPSITRPFCGGCTRARLSPDGQLYFCLFSRRGLDLRGLLRGGESDAGLLDAIRMGWEQREDRYSQERPQGIYPPKEGQVAAVHPAAMAPQAGDGPPKVAMHKVGG
ncbi:MAG: GTP 3',8-cyclase MoaA [Deltaproteobacteria bacterium]|nr:GTP 3',8-cyclase MoaA [Deltaproteobacteria bacterium]